MCDITHGSVRTRPEWTAYTAELPAPFDTYHRDDRPDSIQAAPGGRVPIVLAETASRLVVLLAPDDIAACGSSIDALLSAITRAADDHGLEFRALT